MAIRSLGTYCICRDAFVSRFNFQLQSLVHPCDFSSAMYWLLAIESEVLSGLHKHHSNRAAWKFNLRVSYLKGPRSIYTILMSTAVRSALAASQVASARSVSSPGMITERFSRVPSCLILCQLRPEFSPSFCTKGASSDCKQHTLRLRALYWVWPGYCDKTHA